MRAVNLLPRDESRVEVQGGRSALFIALGGLVAVSVVAVLVAVSASGTASDSEAELEAVQAAIAKVPKAPTAPVSQGVLNQERTDRVAALGAALSSRVAFDRLLRDISLVLPDDAWLTGLTAVSPDESTEASPGAPESDDEISLQGTTYTHAAVARVISRLAVVSALDNVSLESSSVVEPEAETGTNGARPSNASRGKRVVAFTVTATLRTGAGS